VAPGPTMRIGSADTIMHGFSRVPRGCEGAGGPGTMTRQLTFKQPVIHEQRSWRKEWGFCKQMNNRIIRERKPGTVGGDSEKHKNATAQGTGITLGFVAIVRHLNRVGGARGDRPSDGGPQ